MSTSTSRLSTKGRATKVATRLTACANTTERGDCPCLRASARRRRVGFSVLSLLILVPPGPPGSLRPPGADDEPNDEPSGLGEVVAPALSIGQNPPNTLLSGNHGPRSH